MVMLASIAFMMLSPGANAGPCVHEGDDICEIWSPEAIQAFSKAAANVISKISSMASTVISWVEARIIPTWANGVARLAAEEQKQTAMFRTFHQGDAAVKSQLYMQEQAGAAAERAVPPASLTTTVTSGALMSEQWQIVRSKIAKNDAAFMDSFYTQISQDPTTIVQRHKPYCTNAEVANGICDKAASPTMENADLMVNTVLNPGEGQYETLADEERDASLAFVKNIVNPVPVYRQKSTKETPQDQAYDAALLADQAALSIAAHSFNVLIANRTRRHQQ